MRKTMTKQVTKTAIKIAKLVMEEGKPVAKALDDVNVLGNVSLEKAQRMMAKIHPGVTVLQVVTTSDIYEMAVEDFIKFAKIKEATETEEN